MSVMPVDRQYNVLSKLYDLYFGIGTLWVMKNYQKKAVKEIGLRDGDVVLDLGCGTGLLFEYLVREVGPNGRVVGIDISPGMIKKAKEKVKRNEWQNVELVCADLTKHELNVKADAIIFCLTLSLIPDHEHLFRESLKYLKQGGTVVVADSWKQYKKWYHKLTNAFITLKAPIVYSDPDNRLGEIIPRYLNNVTSKEALFGVYSIMKGYTS